MSSDVTQARSLLGQPGPSSQEGVRSSLGRGLALEDTVVLRRWEFQGHKQLIIPAQKAWDPSLTPGSPSSPLLTSELRMLHAPPKALLA